MDYSKKYLSPNSQFGMGRPNTSDSQRRTHVSMEDAEETNENSGHLHEVFGPRSQYLKKENFVSATISSASKKKILAEKNDGPISDFSNTHFKETPQAQPVMGLDHFDSPPEITPLSPRIQRSGGQNGISHDSSRMAPYDPVTNYTSPRPEFLRYNPNWRREILLRIEGEMRDEEGTGVDLTLTSDPKKPVIEESSSMSSTSSMANFQDNEVQESEEGDTDAEDDDMEEEEMEVRPWYSRIVWKTLLLFGVLLSFCYISSMGPAPVPSHEYGVLEQGFLRNTSDLNKYPQNFLEFLMGFSQKCVNVQTREFTCGVGGINHRFLVSHDLIRREDLEEMETYTGISRFHSGGQTVGDEGIGSDLLISNAGAGIVRTGEKEAGFGIEIVSDGVEDVLIQYKYLNGDDEAIGGKSEEASSSGEFVGQLMDEDSERYEIVGPDSEDAGCVPQTHFVSDHPPTNQDTRLDLHGSFETDGSREEAQNMECEDIADIVSHVVSDHQREAFKIPAMSETEFEQESDSMSPSNYVLQLLHPLIYVLMAIVGFLCAVQKYVLKSDKKLSPASPLPPASPLSAAKEEKISSVVKMNDDMENKGNDSNIGQMPLNDLRDEKKFYGIQPPTVQLLGEFSIVDADGSELASGQELTRRGADSGEEAQFSQSQGRKYARKNRLPSDSKAYPSPAQSSFLAEPLSNGGSTVQKPLRKEDNGEAVTQVVYTPLRRSSRLRSRVTSP